MSLSGTTFNAVDTTYTAGANVQIGENNVISATDTIYTHPNITRSDTSNTIIPGYSGTFTTVDSITSNAQGHISAINLKTVTMPPEQIIPTVNNSTITIAAGLGLTTGGNFTLNQAGNKTITLNHSNSITADTSGVGDTTKTLAFGGTLKVPTKVTYDAQGHITGIQEATFTMPANPNTWRPVEVNNVLIGTNTLDLTSGTNVTVSNASGVVTFSSPSLSITNGSGNYVSGISVSGHAITETKANWPTFNQNTTGTAAKADTLKTITTDTAANFYPTFVNSDNATADYESVYTDESFYYNPSTNTLNLSNLSITGTLTTNHIEMIETSNGVIFEGTTADGFETTLYAIDPTADRTIALPNASGTVALTSQIPAVNNGTLVLTPGTYLNRSDSDGSFSANQSGNDTWVLNHDSTSRTDTSSSAAPGYGQTFTTVDSVTSNTTGHITAINLKTVTMPTAQPIPTVNDGTLTISNGGGITGSGTFTANQSGNTAITISHADTSSQTSMTTGGRTYINSITLDTYGHVTALGTGTETVVDTDTWRPISSLDEITDVGNKTTNGITTSAYNMGTSGDTTTKSTMQYNSTTKSIEFIFN